MDGAVNRPSEALLSSALAQRPTTTLFGSPRPLTKMGPRAEPSAGAAEAAAAAEAAGRMWRVKWTARISRWW